MLRTGEGCCAELESIRWHLVPYTRGIGIEIGRGGYKAYPHFLGIREEGDDLGGAAPEVVVKSFHDLGDAVKDESLDFVFAWGAIGFSREIVARLLKPGGFLIDCSTSDGARWGAVSVKGADGMLEYSCPLVPPRREGKTACVVRYGAIGDQMQSSALLPELKRQGYHVTWMCEPLGEELLRHDPHIDAFYVQGKDQVPNHELQAYWAVQREKYDKWINLCESVEGTLLAIPGRMIYGMSHSARRALCDHNYLEFQALMAEQPFHPEHRFYPSAEESAWADARLAEIGEAVNPGWSIGQRWMRPFVVMWATAGSGPNKVYPHMDAVMARILLEIPNAHIVTVGGMEGKILEAGWEDEPRVTCMSGEAGIRDVLALAQRCDLVIGPETGVLNAVAFESNAKIVFLSHSSHENLTKHWNNTDALHSASTPCYPCHQMHSTFEHCAEHEPSGTAMCQWQLGPDGVWDAVKRAYVAWGSARRILEAA